MRAMMLSLSCRRPNCKIFDLRARAADERRRYVNFSNYYKVLLASDSTFKEQLELQAWLVKESHRRSVAALRKMEEASEKLAKKIAAVKELSEQEQAGFHSQIVQLGSIQLHLQKHIAGHRYHLTEMLPAFHC